MIAAPTYITSSGRLVKSPSVYIPASAPKRSARVTTRSLLAATTGSGSFECPDGAEVVPHHVMPSRIPPRRATVDTRDSSMSIFGSYDSRTVSSPSADGGSSH